MKIRRRFFNSKERWGFFTFWPYFFSSLILLGTNTNINNYNPYQRNAQLYIESQSQSSVMLRNDATTTGVVLLVIRFLSQLLDNRVEVVDDVEKRRTFLIDRAPHVSHQRH